ncbi:TonB-dependent receptor [Lujinxingia vulgaris]|uniref:TonB-dependent receptor n=1 Tax=Lujinxingia vulgaris TaxID=2600176 RepID=A0A5C6XBT1_9DELT|nr:TonB-dependent receptor [Lujinxingia vulgaris]TXD36197.1 TonB-dependent receptor [Lujinxingia vulgaris]
MTPLASPRRPPHTPRYLLRVLAFSLALSPTSAFAQDASEADGTPEASTEAPREDRDEERTAPEDEGAPDATKSLTEAPTHTADPTREKRRARGPLVVTGTRRAQRIEDSPVPVTVIDRDAIEASGARDVSEILAAQAGAELVPTVGGTGVRLQGMDSDYVLILVDGQRVAGRVNGVVDLDRFNARNIEQVEVLRGPGSALYGADAMAGVINIITRKSKEPYEAEATLGYGQRNQIEAGGRAGMNREGWRAHLEANHRQADGYDLSPQDIFSTGSAYNETQAGAGGALDLGEHWELGARGSYLLRRQERVDPGASRAVFDRLNAYEDGLASIYAQHEGQGRLRTTATFQVFRNQFFYDQRRSDALDRYEDSSESQAIVESVYERTLSDTNILTLGVEGALHRFDSERLEGGGGARDRLALFAQDEWFFGDAQQLVLMPGIRLDLDSQYGFHPSPALSARYQVFEDLNLLGSAAMAYRAPSFQELLLDFENPAVGYVIEGNPDLEPETSRSFQLGAQWRPLERLDVEINLFWNELDNLIGTTTTESAGAGQALVFSYKNIASARTRGLESMLRLRPGKGVRLELGYTLTDTLDRDQSRPLEGRAPHRLSFTFGADRLPLGLKANLRAQLTSARTYYFDGTTELAEPEIAPPSALVDAHLWRDFGDHFSVSLQGTNLLNQGDARFLPIAPRALFAALSARY